MTSKNILIIYHSQGGNNLKLARACQSGVEKEEGVTVRLQQAFDTDLEDVKWSEGVIIVTPEYFGYMSGAMKDFFDRTYYPSRELNLQRPYCLAICCENDGEGAKRNIEKLASGYILKPVQETLIIHEHELDARIIEGEELGRTFAAGLLMGIF